MNANETPTEEPAGAQTADVTTSEASVVRAWIGGEGFGLVLTGDPMLRERVWHAIVEHAGIEGAPSAGPGTDLSDLHTETDPWTGARKPGLLERARHGALLLPTAHLLSPAQAAALARAPRILAQAPTLADIPAALASRLTAVLHLPHRPGDADVLRSALSEPYPSVPRDAEPPGTTSAPSADEVVALLTRHGLADHAIDLGACRLAQALVRTGCTTILDTIERVVCHARSSPAQNPHPDTTPDPSSDRNPDPGTDPSPNPDPGSGPNPGPNPEPDPDPGSEFGQEHGAPEADTTGRPPTGPATDPSTGNADDRQSAEAPEQPPQPPQPPGTIPSGHHRQGRARHHAVRNRLDGRQGAPGDHPTRGRRRRVVPIEAAGGRADVLATLTAALPWQRGRGGRPGGALIVHPQDLRGRTRRLPGGRLLIVIVDASGSMAQHMIRRAKAIAMAELDRAYRERSTVCIVLARGPHAVTGLPPTRSTTRARDALRALPTGGGTPLASAFDLAAQTARRYDPEQVDVMILTDGRANVGLTGDPRSDAVRTVRHLATTCRTIHLDPVTPRTGPDPTTWLRQALTEAL
ncbi:VWA domain-containing protein [Nonomuraea maritima]|uniref:VWA domain-containing protein n=1 Tax=Nonomuraea maritima TaxID=683260 RepID=UPI0037197C7C